jgi:hypothetical protein
MAAKKAVETKSKKSAAVSTPVRNTAIPKVAAKKPLEARAEISREITSEMIAKRAFEIYASGKGGSESDNWFAAERELRAGI